MASPFYQNQLKSPDQLREVLQQGVFGQRSGNPSSNIGAAMRSTFSNLRNGPPMAPDFATQNAAANAGIYAPGSFGDQNSISNGNAFGMAPAAAPAAARAPAPVLGSPAPVGLDPFSAGIAPLGAAAALTQAGQAGQTAVYQQRLRDAGINLDPNLPGFEQQRQAAIGIFNTSFGGGGAGAPAASGIHAYAPTGLRQQALAANGAPVTGFGGARVTATPAPAVDSRLPVYQQNQIPGNRFTLTQDPNTVPGAPGYVSRAAPQATMAAQVAQNSGPSPDAMRFLATGEAPSNLAALNPGIPTAPSLNTPPAPVQNAPAQASTQTQQRPQNGATPFEQAQAALRSQASYTAPDGSIFSRDAHGRLVPAGTDPQLAAQAKGQAAAAEEEGKQTVISAHKAIDDATAEANAAQSQIQNIRRVNELLDAGAKTGFGQTSFTALASAISRWTGKETKIANQQELEKILGQVSLEMTKDLAKGGGSISNYERELFSSATANKNLSPQANRQILQAMGQVAQRRIALGNERIRLENLGLPSVQIAKELRAYNQQLIGEADSKYNQSSSSAQPQKVGKYSVTVAR